VDIHTQSERAFDLALAALFELMLEAFEHLLL
jgi:hypothetical protein